MASRTEYNYPDIVDTRAMALGILEDLRTAGTSPDATTALAYATLHVGTQLALLNQAVREVVDDITEVDIELETPEGDPDDWVRMILDGLAAAITELHR